MSTLLISCLSQMLMTFGHKCVVTIVFFAQGYQYLLEPKSVVFFLVLPSFCYITWYMSSYNWYG